MPLPSVSVVIPFLNAERYIHDAVQSIMLQTFGDWELLLVDDGSTDESTVIAKAFAEHHPARVRYFEHPGHQNKGIGPSRNLGIAASRGKFIAFLDSDDSWFPQKLDKQVALLIANPGVGAIVNPAVYSREDGTRRVQPMTLPAGAIRKTGWIAPMLVDGNNAGCPSSVVLRRDVVAAVGGFEESIGNLYEDQAMWCKVSLNSSIYFDPEPLTLYRIHSMSTCVSASRSRQLEEQALFCAWLVRYLESQGSHFRLSFMAQCRLVEALVRMSRLGEPAVRRGWPTPAGRRRNLKVAQIHQQLLHPALSLILRVGAVLPPAGLGISKIIFMLYTRRLKAIEAGKR